MLGYTDVIQLLHNVIFLMVSSLALEGLLIELVVFFLV